MTEIIYDRSVIFRNELISSTTGVTGGKFVNAATRRLISRLRNMTGLNKMSENVY